MPTVKPQFFSEKSQFVDFEYYAKVYGYRIHPENVVRVYQYMLVKQARISKKKEKSKNKYIQTTSFVKGMWNRYKLNLLLN